MIAQADEAPSAHGAAHAAVAAAADSGLYVSDTPVAGNYLRVDASTTVKYQILTVAGERPGAPLHLAVFNDFFETYETRMVNATGAWFAESATWRHGWCVETGECHVQTGESATWR